MPAKMTGHVPRRRTVAKLKTLLNEFNALLQLVKDTCSRITTIPPPSLVAGTWSRVSPVIYTVKSVDSFYMVYSAHT